MKERLFNRRRFITDGSKAVAGIALLSSLANNTWAYPRKAPRIRFSVISINHSHIYGMIESVIKGGGELVSVYAKEPELIAAFSKNIPRQNRPAHIRRYSKTVPYNWC